MSEDTLAAAIVQADKELRALMDVLATESGDRPLDSAKLEEIKRLAAQAYDVLQQAARKVQA